MTLFTLATAGHFYEKDSAEKLEKLGFKFTEYKSGVLCIKSDPVEIKIETLDELLALAKEYGDLVISAGEEWRNIEICDDCRE